MRGPPADTAQGSTLERIIRDDSRCRSVYADAFTVRSTREEISLLLGTSRAGQREDDTAAVDLTNRIALNPFAAKRLAVQLKHVILEHESKYGPLGAETRSPPAPVDMSPQRREGSVAEAGERAAALFQAMETLNAAVGVEQSFKIVKGNLLGNRFLVGVNKEAIRERRDEKLIEICSSIGMPETLFAVFKKYLPAGNYVHFGFEQTEHTAVYKVYLEFWERIRAGIERTGQRPGPTLLHLGLKWDVSNPARQALTRYIWHPWLLPDAIMERVSGVLHPHTDAPSRQAADALVSLALARVPHHDILYLDVTEEGNPRRSFDINVYRADLRVEEVYPLLSVLCRRHSIAYDTFHSLYDRIKMKSLGHLAAGVDREGKDFFTVYYGVERAFGRGSGESGLIKEEPGIVTKFTPPVSNARVARVEETDYKANLLFRLVKGLGVPEAVEHSFKFLDGTLLIERFLTGFKRSGVNAVQDEHILNICRQMDMPVEFQLKFQAELREADIVLFAFEKNEKSRVYKAYLEFNGRLAEAAGQDPKPESVVIHTGFKWDASDNSRKVLAKYTAYPLFRAQEVAVRVLNSFYGDAGNDCHPIVDDILDLAGSRTRPGELLYFEVSEEDNPRNSFDINVYRADLRMAEIYPMLIRMARRFSIDLTWFNELYKGVREQKFGHLSGGTDREERDFLTVYFGQKGSSRQGSFFSKQSHPSIPFR